MSDAVVDLRSDTVTRPTASMRRAMAEAEVGDDALEGDPTTRRLEGTVAELLGKPRALFVPSGIMGNQVALAALGRPGTEVVLEAGAHILHWEEGAASALSGLQLRPVEGSGGRMPREDVERVLASTSPYRLRASVLALENTHLDSGGRVLPLEAARELAEAAWGHGLRVHLDGARLWHAEAATGTPVRAWAEWADTAMVTLSKGLGAPVGSVLAGPDDILEEAWRIRRRLGGAMRQSGVLAAAGLHALEHHRADLRRDHDHARMLAKGIRDTAGLPTSDPETNIVFVEVPAGRADEVLNFLAVNRILMIKFASDRLRAVTHRDVDRPGIKRTVDVLARASRALDERGKLA